MTTNELRELQSNETVLAQIQDVVKLEVDTSFDDNLNREITSYYLEKISNDTLTIGIDFSDPNSISSYITDPDTLKIEIVQPDLFIGSESGIPLRLEDAAVEIVLQK